MMATDRRKYSPSVKDKPMSVTSEFAKSCNDIFIADFLASCEEFQVQPLPKLTTSVRSVNRKLSRTTQMTRSLSMMEMARFSKSEPGKAKTSYEDAVEEPSPVIYLTFETKKRHDVLRGLESKGCEITIHLLDALHTSIRKYDTIRVLKLQNCRVNAYGIVQIALMLTEIGALRDLNLDMNPNVQENYHLLCAPVGKLEYLSLKYCKISSKGAEKIGHELKYHDPPYTRLIYLNLANNNISVEGAIHLGAMLRSNRCLQSLILTANGIQDEGALAIIKELEMSTLTHAETVDLRRRRYALLEKQCKTENENNNGALTKRDTYKLSTQSLRRPKKSTNRDNSSTLKDLIASQGTVTSSLGGSADLSAHVQLHPFLKETFPLRGSIMLNGNFCLQHLNLSFNMLTKWSLHALVACVNYQDMKLLDDQGKGLVHVFILGNKFDDDNEVLATLTNALQRRRSPHNKFSVDEQSVQPVVISEPTATPRKKKA